MFPLNSDWGRFPKADLGHSSGIFALDNEVYRIPLVRSLLSNADYKTEPNLRIHRLFNQAHSLGR